MNSCTDGYLSACYTRGFAPQSSVLPPTAAVKSKVKGQKQKSSVKDQNNMLEQIKSQCSVIPTVVLQNYAFANINSSNFLCCFFKRMSLVLQLQLGFPLSSVFL